MNISTQGKVTLIVIITMFFTILFAVGIYIPQNNISKPDLLLPKSVNNNRLKIADSDIAFKVNNVWQKELNLFVPNDQIINVKAYTVKDFILFKLVSAEFISQDIAFDSNNPAAVISTTKIVKKDQGIIIKTSEKANVKISMANYDSDCNALSDTEYNCDLPDGIKEGVYEATALVTDIAGNYTSIKQNIEYNLLTTLGCNFPKQSNQKTFNVACTPNKQLTLILNNKETTYKAKQRFNIALKLKEGNNDLNYSFYDANKEKITESFNVFVDSVKPKLISYNVPQYLNVKYGSSLDHTDGTTYKISLTFSKDVDLDMTIASGFSKYLYQYGAQGKSKRYKAEVKKDVPYVIEIKTTDYFINICNKQKNCSQKEPTPEILVTFTAKDVFGNVYSDYFKTILDYVK